MLSLELNTSTIPIACIPDAIPQAQRPRYEQTRRWMRDTAQSVEELTDGLQMHFSDDTATIQNLAEFIGLERLCCPFIDFTLEVPSGETAVILRLRGSTHLPCAPWQKLASLSRSRGRNMCAS